MKKSATCNEMPAFAMLLISGMALAAFPASAQLTPRTNPNGKLSNMGSANANGTLNNTSPVINNPGLR